MGALKRTYIDCPRCDSEGWEEIEHPDRLTIKRVPCSACDEVGRVEARPCTSCPEDCYSLAPILDPWGNGKDLWTGGCSECEEEKVADREARWRRPAPDKEAT